MSRIAFVFPGQGSQYVGMGSELSRFSQKAARVFEEANETVKFDLRTLCWDGPSEVLNQTEYTQPAMLTTSMAALEVLRQEGIHPSLAAGHSLGEYSALVAARSISFPVALRLVRNRGRYMQDAVEHGKGAMAAVLGLSESQVTTVCHQASERGIVNIANLNSPVQIVISGEKTAVDYACELASNLGAKRVIPLAVSVPSHSLLMEPAATRLAQELENLPISDPQFPIITNVDAKAITKKEEIRDALIRQLASPVRWVDCLLELRNRGVKEIIEVGPGKVLTGLLKRTVPEIRGIHVEDSRSLKDAKQALSL